MTDLGLELKFAVHHIRQDTTFTGSLWLDGVKVASATGAYERQELAYTRIIDTAEVEAAIRGVVTWKPVYARAQELFERGWEWPDASGWWWSLRKEVWDAGIPIQQHDWTPVLVADRLTGAGKQLEHRDGTVIRQGEMAGSWAWFPASMTDYCLGLCPD